MFGGERVGVDWGYMVGDCYGVFEKELLKGRGFY